MSRGRDHGFTLIEVLVALLVIAIAYTGVAAAISGFADQRRILVERQTSHRIAWNRLMEQYLVSRGVPVRERDFAADKGSTFARGGRWQWRVTEEKAAGQNLVRYEVDVYAPGATEENPPSGSMSAFFTRPAEAPGL